MGTTATRPCIRRKEEAKTAVLLREVQWPYEEEEEYHGQKQEGALAISSYV